MKKLEIIRRIVEEKPDIDILNFLENNSIYNLTLLCCLNKKYLSEENFNIIINEKQIPIKYLLGYSYKSKYKNDNYDYSLIALLISKYPKLLYKLNKKVKFNNDDWAKIIQEQPKLFNECKFLYKLTAYNWSKILQKQPELIKYCDIIDKFEKNDWINILKYQPQLSTKYKNLYKEIDEFSAIKLIDSNKNIVNYIDFSKINFSEDTY